MISELFEDWLKDTEGKSVSTAYQYRLGIKRLSKQYSRATGKRVNIYSISDLDELKLIERACGDGGMFSYKGIYVNGTDKSAIAAYVQFYQSMEFDGNDGDETDFGDEDFDDNDFLDETSVSSKIITFSREKSLENSFAQQVLDFFPGYTVYSNDNEGIDFPIKGGKIDLLLENKSENTLLAIVLKNGKAKYDVFGKIAMFLGCLSKIFPSKVLKGVIIAGEIDDSLKYACLTNDNIRLKTYQSKFTLDEPE